MRNVDRNIEKCKIGIRLFATPNRCEIFIEMRTQNSKYFFPILKRMIFSDVLSYSTFLNVVTNINVQILLIWFSRVVALLSPWSRGCAFETESAKKNISKVLWKKYNNCCFFQFLQLQNKFFLTFLPWIKTFLMFFWMHKMKNFQTLTDLSKYYLPFCNITRNFDGLKATFSYLINKPFQQIKLQTYCL